MREEQGLSTGPRGRGEGAHLRSALEDTRVLLLWQLHRARIPGDTVEVGYEGQ